MTEKKCVNLGTPQTCEPWDTSNFPSFKRKKVEARVLWFCFVFFFPCLKLSREVPNGPVVNTELPVQWVRVRSLMEEPKSYIPNSMAENK